MELYSLTVKIAIHVVKFRFNIPNAFLEIFLSGSIAKYFKGNHEVTIIYFNPIYSVTFWKGLSDIFLSLHCIRAFLMIKWKVSHLITYYTV